MHLFPLWSAVLQTDAIRFAFDCKEPVAVENATVCRSNAVIESHFKNVKHGTLMRSTRLRPRAFLNKNLTFVMGKLQESKLPENPRFSKKPMKRVVQDTPERWSRRKKLKRYSNIDVAHKVLQPS